MNSKTKDCAHCGEGNIIETLMDIANRSAQDNGYRYHCDNEKCGLKFRVDHNNRAIILVSSKWGKVSHE